MARITVIVSENPRFVKRGFFLLDISVIMCYSIRAATGVSITRSSPSRQTEGNGAPLSCLDGAAWKAGRAEYPSLLFLYPHPPPAPRGGSAAPKVIIEDHRISAIEGRSLTSESNVSGCIYPHPAAESNVPPPRTSHCITGSRIICAAVRSNRMAATQRSAPQMPAFGGAARP